MRTLSENQQYNQIVYKRHRSYFDARTNFFMFSMQKNWI